MEFKQLVIEESKGNINEAYNKEWAIREWGKDEGREEGKKETWIEVAKKMLEEDEDLNKIHNFTGLATEEIEKLRKEINTCR